MTNIKIKKKVWDLEVLNAWANSDVKTLLLFYVKHLNVYNKVN